MGCPSLEMFQYVSQLSLLVGITIFRNGLISKYSKSSSGHIGKFYQPWLKIPQCRVVVMAPQCAVVMIPQCALVVYHLVYISQL